MSTLILGVDPGQTGALAQVHYDTNYPLVPLVASVWDIPQLKTGGIDYPRLFNLVLNDLPTNLDAVAIEKVGTRPGQGISSSGKFMYGAGFLHGLLGPVTEQLVFVTPQTWKKSLKLIGKDKHASLALARKIFPSMRSGLTRLKDHGRAEALLIAWWMLAELNPRYAKTYLQTT